MSEYVEQIDGSLVVRVFDGVEDAGSREEAAAFAFDCLLCEEEDGLVGVPVLIEIAVLFVLEEEQFDFFLHDFFNYAAHRFQIQN